MRSARQYVESARANEIPIIHVGDYLHGLSGIFSLLDAKHPNFNESIPDLAEFIKLVLHCIDTWPVENEFVSILLLLIIYTKPINAPESMDQRNHR